MPIKYGWAVVLLALSFSGNSLEQAAAQSSGSGGTPAEMLLEQLERRNAEFDSANWPARGRFSIAPDFVETYADFNRRLWRDYGLTYLYSPTIMWQGGTQKTANRTVNIQHNAFLAWRAFDKTAVGTGTFVANVLQVRQLTKTTGIDFTQSLGTSYLVSDSAGDSDALKALYWRQDFPGDVLTVRLGHDEVASLVNSCQYSCDDTQSFISAPLSANPASTVPGQGLAAIAEVQLSSHLAVDVGVADGNGDGKLNPGRPFTTGELAYVASTRILNPFEALGAGTYRLSFYAVDPLRQGTASAQKASSGLSVTIEQDIADFGVFAKYATSFGRSGSVKQFASGGVIWKKPFGNDEDWLGLGAGWVDPSGAGLRDEFVAETFYRLQLTPLTQISAGAMLVVDPSKRAESSTEGVLNLRARMHF